MKTQQGFLSHQDLIDPLHNPVTDYIRETIVEDRSLHAYVRTVD